MVLTPAKEFRTVPLVRLPSIWARRGGDPRLLPQRMSPGAAARPRRRSPADAPEMSAATIDGKSGRMNATNVPEEETITSCAPEGPRTVMASPHRKWILLSLAGL